MTFGAAFRFVVIRSRILRRSLVQLAIALPIGVAGATAAKYLRLWGGAGVQVTLIERDPQYYTCILSNLILNGSRALSNQTFTYTRLTRNYGVNVVQGDVFGIDPITQRVRTLDGREFPYDKVIVAPGVDFATIPGLESPEAQAAVLHAWKAGPQTLALRDQIRALPAGGLFVITIPQPPFRATAAPYDRACIVADYLERNKPGSKVLVLGDAASTTQPKGGHVGNAQAKVCAEPTERRGCRSSSSTIRCHGP